MVVDCEEQETVLSQTVTNSDERLYPDNHNQEIEFKEAEAKKKQEAIKKLTSTLQDLSKLAIAIKTRAEMEKKGLFTTKKGPSNCSVQVSGNEEDGKTCDIQEAQQTLEKPDQTTATGSGETFTPQDCTESFLLTVERIIASLQDNAENGIKDDTVPENPTPILSTATSLKLEQEHHSTCAKDTQPVSFDEKVAADECMKKTFFDCPTPKQDVPLPTAVLHKKPSEESTEADTDTLHGRLSQKTLNGAANTSFADKSMDTDADTVLPCREQEIEAVDIAIKVETALENTQEEEVIEAAKPSTTENLLSSALPKSLIGEQCDFQPTKVLPSELETSVVERVLTNTNSEKADEMELDISPLFDLVDPDLPPTESTLLAPLKSYPPAVEPGVWVVFEGPHTKPDLPPAASDELNTQLNLTTLPSMNVEQALEGLNDENFKYHLASLLKMDLMEFSSIPFCFRTLDHRELCLSFLKKIRPQRKTSLFTRGTLLIIAFTAASFVVPPGAVLKTIANIDWNNYKKSLNVWFSNARQLGSAYFESSIFHQV